MGAGCSCSATSVAPADPAGDDRNSRIQLCLDSLRRNGGRLFVSGVLQRANLRNRNGRVYPKGILKREADRYHSSHVLTNRALGELDHPNPNSATFRYLNYANVSHQVLEYSWSGDDLVGTVEVLPTPAGAMLKDLYLAGCRLGMSSRGWATLRESDGAVLIQDDFELITFDFVSDPSTEGAYLAPCRVKYLPPVEPELDEILTRSRDGCIAQVLDSDAPFSHQGKDDPNVDHMATITAAERPITSVEHTDGTSTDHGKITVLPNVSYDDAPGAAVKAEKGCPPEPPVEPPTPTLQMPLHGTDAGGGRGHPVAGRDNTVIVRAVSDGRASSTTHGSRVEQTSIRTTKPSIRETHTHLQKHGPRGIASPKRRVKL